MATDTKQKAEIINQRICDQLVRREVIYCVSSLIHEMTKNPHENPMFGQDSGYHVEDDLYCLLQQDDWQSPGEYVIGEWTEDECREYLESRDVEHSRRLGLNKLQALATAEAEEQGWQEFCEEHRIDSELIEAYEHWIVSSWFKARLAEKGEMTGDLFGMDIWGRATTGQAISMDSVIRQIASDMEILHGQRNEWKAD